MSLLDKVKDSLATRAAEAIAASLTVLLAWAAYQIAPSVLPAIEAAVSKQVLLALLVTSVALNVVFLFTVWFVSRREPLRLKCGIYWDREKNPHCPSCKTPVAAYGKYSVGGEGYYCKPCGKVFPLADASGRRIPPDQVVSQL